MDTLEQTIRALLPPGDWRPFGTTECAIAFICDQERVLVEKELEGGWRASISGSKVLRRGTGDTPEAALCAAVEAYCGRLRANIDSAERRLAGWSHLAPDPMLAALDLLPGDDWHVEGPETKTAVSAFNHPVEATIGRVDGRYQAIIADCDDEERSTPWYGGETPADALRAAIRDWRELLEREGVKASAALAEWSTP